MNDLSALHERLKSRIAREGRRETIDTIPPDPARRARSLRHCHLPSDLKPLITWRPDNGRYIPELSASLEDDPNLSDGARRCARKIAEYIYRHNRDSRSSEITVSYLARGLGRCRRSVHRYLRQLEHGGYIEVAVIASARSRLCVGLVVRLLRPLFAKHHTQKWPEKRDVPGATGVSLKQRFRYKTYLISRPAWAQRCCEGVWRSYMKTLPALLPIS